MLYLPLSISMAHTRLVADVSESIDRGVVVGSGTPQLGPLAEEGQGSCGVQDARDTVKHLLEMRGEHGSSEQITRATRGAERACLLLRRFAATYGNAWGLACACPRID